MWTEAKRSGFTLGDIVRWMGEGPAKLSGFHKRKGKIAAGHDADFVVFDSETEFVLGAERLHYRHRVSPYLGEKLFGIVKETYVRGQCVFSEGRFPGVPSGKEYRL